MIWQVVFVLKVPNLIICIPIQLIQFSLLYTGRNCWWLWWILPLCCWACGFRFVETLPRSRIRGFDTRLGGDFQFNGFISTGTTMYFEGVHCFFLEYFAIFDNVYHRMIYNTGLICRKQTLSEITLRTLMRYQNPACFGLARFGANMLTSLRCLHTTFKHSSFVWCYPYWLISDSAFFCDL